MSYLTFTLSLDLLNYNHKKHLGWQLFISQIEAVLFSHPFLLSEACEWESVGGMCTKSVPAVPSIKEQVTREM